jgi:hypothetical protein
VALFPEAKKSRRQLLIDAVRVNVKYYFTFPISPLIKHLDAGVVLESAQESR